MNYNSTKSALFVALFSVIGGVANAQGVDLNKVNTITTAVPFLRIVNDTRSGGMGDVGIAMSADAGGAQLNGAKMAWVENDFGVNVSFTPWLKALVNDIYLANLSGYYRIKEVQTVHASLRYFSLGQIQFKDDQGNDIGQNRPQEVAADVGYARRFGIVSVGVTLRFIYSNITGNTTTVGGNNVKPGVTGAADIGVLVRKEFEGSGDNSHEIYAGLCLSNLGGKISYTNASTKDYIPANLGLGLGYVYNINKKNSIGAYLDLNRLMVPTPVSSDILYNTPNTPSSGIKPEYDKNTNGVADYKEMSSIGGMANSFAYAPSGVSEKFKEMAVGVGVEYFYKKMFGVRAGYFYEDPIKGNRNFMSVGASVKYSVAALHLSYLVPVSQQKNPLDNTFRFTLNFEFSKGGTRGGYIFNPSSSSTSSLH